MICSTCGCFFAVNHCASKLLALVDLMDFIFEQNEESDMERRIS